MAPVKMLWFGMPKIIENNFRGRMLFDDIYIINAHWENARDLRKGSVGQEVVYLINLDSLTSDTSNDIQKISLEITEIFKNSPRVVIHSTQLNTGLSDFFRKHNMLYLEKNMTDPVIAYSILANYTQFFFKGQKQKSKSLISASYLPEFKYKVAIKNLSSEQPAILAWLDKVNNSGISLRLINPDDLKKFNIKDLVTLKSNLDGLFLKVHKALVRQRKDEDLLIGLYIDLANPNMISSEDASLITGTLLKLMDAMIVKQGITEDLNFMTYKTSNEKL